MTTVALIGGDGAGKTTLAKDLSESGPIRAKYLYMGISAQSSTRLLPTSRLVLALKRAAYRREVIRATGRTPTTDRIPANHYEYSKRKRGSAWITARYLNRMAEAWYRQLVSLSYEARGYLVIYDRHFLFDGDLLTMSREDTARPLAERVYRWVMHRAYPRPDLVIFLDAPGKVLYRRKEEAGADYLDGWRERYLAQAASVKQFVRIDASQPFAVVRREATAAVEALTGNTEGQEPS